MSGVTACEGVRTMMFYKFQTHCKHLGYALASPPVMNLKTEFLVRSEPGMGETWTARITGQPRINRPLLVSLILYIYNEGAGDMAFVTSQ